MTVSVHVTVNGEHREVPGGTTVGEAVDAFGRGRRGVAVAINGEVVPRSAWDATPVREGDRIEILNAAQGG